MAVAIVTLTSCQKQLSQPSNALSSEQTIGAILKNAADEANGMNGEVLTSSNGGAPSNPLAHARSKARFSVLTVALAKTGLLNTLMRLDGDYTLFAPTDEAFAAAGLSTSDITKLPEETLKGILLYHVVGAKVPAAAVPANAAVATLNGKKIFVRSSAAGVAINLSKVTLADVMAKNGVIHVIDKVLLPPTQSIVDIVVSDTSFSLLKTAVLRASQGTTNVAALLSGAGPFTVFAPVNNAFRALGLNEAAINGTAPDALTPILAYHVINNAAVFSIDLTNGITPTMLAGGTTTITLTGGAKIKGKSNASASNIIATDIITTNGVIHVIDSVLLP